MQPSTAALTFNPTHGAHARKDFPLPAACGPSPHGGRLVLHGEDFPLAGVSAEQIRELQAAGWIEFGPAPARTAKRAADRRAKMKADAKVPTPVTKPAPSSKPEGRPAR